MHLYLPSRLYCLSLLLDQKLQVPSVETFLLYITVKSVICQLKYFISVFLAAFVTITWYVNGNVHLMMAFLSLLVANYGRLDSHSCPHWMTSDTNCHSGNSLAQMQKICQSNSTCELEATNVFFGGDPCMGTYKYLFVEYQCQ